MSEKHNLDEQLRHLHRELQHLESIDPQERHLLQQVQRDIQAILAHRGHQDLLSSAQLGKQLRESIEQLETSHPSVTLVMGQVAEMLARMGI